LNPELNTQQVAALPKAKQRHSLGKSLDLQDTDVSDMAYAAENGQTHGSAMHPQDVENGASSKHGANHQALWRETSDSDEEISKGRHSNNGGAARRIDAISGRTSDYYARGQRSDEQRENEERRNHSEDERESFAKHEHHKHLIDYNTLAYVHDSEDYLGQKKHQQHPKKLMDYKTGGYVRDSDEENGHSRHSHNLDNQKRKYVHQDDQKNAQSNQKHTQYLLDYKTDGYSHQNEDLHNLEVIPAGFDDGRQLVLYDDARGRHPEIGDEYHRGNASGGLAVDVDLKRGTAENIRYKEDEWGVSNEGHPHRYNKRLQSTPEPPLMTRDGLFDRVEGRNSRTQGGEGHDGQWERPGGSVLYTQ